MAVSDSSNPLQCEVFWGYIYIMNYFEETNKDILNN